MLKLPESLDFRKRETLDALLVVLIIAVAFVSFFLGRLSIGNTEPSSIRIIPGEDGGALQAAVSNAPVPGGVVASKTGSKYHLPWCSGAQTIREENKVWFPTPEAARAAGYTPAANCKGIQ
jgi:hypothetical protein